MNHDSNLAADKLIRLCLQENTYLWRTSLYLAASASAEFFADIALCPMDAIKVRIQTQPGWSTTLREGFPRILKEEGISGSVLHMGRCFALNVIYRTAQNQLLKFSGSCKLGGDILESLLCLGFVQKISSDSLNLL